VVAHADREAGRTRVVVDRVQAWVPRPGQPVDLRAVEEWLMAAHGSYGQPVLVADPWQFLSMAQRLRAGGMRVEEFTFSAQSVGRLALTLHRLLREHLIALPDDPELLEELANVRLRETSPGNYRLDHDPGQHDDRAIALALAAYHLVEAPNMAWVDTSSHADRGWYTHDGQFMPPASWLLDPDRVGF
jgi:phage terminase large subunit-like protein